MIGKCSRIDLWLSVFITSSILLYGSISWAQDKRNESSQAESKDLPEMPPQIYDKLLPATVKIILDKGNKNGSGSLVGLTPKGLAIILTACHVVARNFEDTNPTIPLEFHEDIQVKMATEVEPVPARAIPDFVDRANDLAFIVTNTPVSVGRIISYTSANDVKPGQKAAALGYPDSDKLSQTVGRITRRETNYLVFDAKIAPGSSGGPLINNAGRMVGMSIHVESNEGYAVDMNLVIPIVEGWLEKLELKKKWQHQKYTTALEKTVRDWRFLTGTMGGGTLIYILLSITDYGFPSPPGRPPEDN